MAAEYDAVLLVSFGGPEGPDDVMPFLENVLRGKNVPRQRLLEVASHYQHFGGISPINAQNRQLQTQLQRALDERGPRLPVYWGNRNWHPMLADTVAQMASDGIGRALAFVTAAFSSYSGCRQYLENIEQARRAVGPRAPQIDKLRLFYNHPGFIEPIICNTRRAVEQISAERYASTRLVFTAHSIPLVMAETSQYVEQLREACRLVAREFSELPWDLVYQSRSGPPNQPWLEPDIGGYLASVAATTTDVVMVPVGFVSDHMEVLFDLDTEARQQCTELGLRMLRVPTVGNSPRFVEMIRELILERTTGAERLFLGSQGPAHDTCPADCCHFVRPQRS